ncbi:MAG TPA: c-type cytochrome [Zoogloea sp.]|uniref:c-type cytochrome n=1 Tax=Zoogloea sp. TaxID=49181 RepID=UPI002C1F72A6|nr:c-type cytochrome [Zoogloea sp.]HMV19013.1 c-type cytochrome [Rhodocyclaceae bacterium]HMV63743.1 c-type cytochrome [Rhodocyclaceae bacterium]HMW52019.1 c-type cytochrome [Rhodocyclaceae bacterium]HMY50795.1 c-type cytochrome [Rhodocyclaceae bacterium]HMZ76713.1 c-type cytochrome [Rhodocyclaceae bacterium]
MSDLLRSAPARHPVRLVLTLGVAALATQMAGCGNKAAVDEELAAKLTQPVASVVLTAAPAAAPGSRSGEDIYKAVCSACHASGAAGAPKAGDKAAWGPRLGAGLAGLVKSATNGKNAMPPKGGAADLTDTELTRAVAFLANQAGAGFKEPQ